MYRIYRYEYKDDKPYRHLYLYRDNIIPYDERAEPQPHEHRLDESLYRTRRIVKDTLLCNDFTYFCTFTFSADKVADRTDYKTLSSQLRKFFNNYKTRYCSDFRYLLIPEFHKDGAIHFHGVCNVLYGLCTPLYRYKRICDGFLQAIPNKEHYLDWKLFSDKFGYFSCSRIRDNERCATYVSKYITKQFSSFGKNIQLVMKSKGLNKPELVYTSNSDYLMVKPTDCDNDFCKSAWCDDDYTARYYQHWNYNGCYSNISEWFEPPKEIQYKDFFELTGCTPLGSEQLCIKDFLREDI